MNSTPSLARVKSIVPPVSLCPRCETNDRTWQRQSSNSSRIPNRETAKSEDVEQGIFFVLELLTKASYALAASNFLNDNDVDRVCNLIAKVPDPYPRAALQSTLAFYLWRAQDSRRFSEVVNQKVWPTLSNLSGKDQAGGSQSVEDGVSSGLARRS